MVHWRLMDVYKRSLTAASNTFLQWWPCSGQETLSPSASAAGLGAAGAATVQLPESIIHRKSAEGWTPVDVYAVQHSPAHVALCQSRTKPETFSSRERIDN